MTVQIVRHPNRSRVTLLTPIRITRSDCTMAFGSVMKRFDTAAWRRHKAAAWALLTQLRISTPPDAFATVAPWAIGIVIALVYPGDGLGKVVAGSAGWAVVQVIRYFWILRTLPEEPKPVIGWSPLYTPEGQEKFHEERQRKIDQLSSMLAQQPEKRAEIERELAKVKATGLGFTPRSSQRRRSPR
jgi:hypothetical protein